MATHAPRHAACRAPARSWKHLTGDAQPSHWRTEGSRVCRSCSHLSGQRKPTTMGHPSSAARPTDARNSRPKLAELGEERRLVRRRRMLHLGLETEPPRVVAQAALLEQIRGDVPRRFVTPGDGLEHPRVGRALQRRGWARGGHQVEGDGDEHTPPGTLLARERQLSLELGERSEAVHPQRLEASVNHLDEGVGKVGPEHVEVPATALDDGPHQTDLSLASNDRRSPARGGEEERTDSVHVARLAMRLAEHLLGRPEVDGAARVQLRSSACPHPACLAPQELVR